MPRLESPYQWDVFVAQLRSEHFLGVTQEDLARRLHVSVFTVSKWECGKAVPVPRLRVKLKKLGIAAGYTEQKWPTVTKRMAVIKPVKS